MLLSASLFFLTGSIDIKVGIGACWKSSVNSRLSFSYARTQTALLCFFSDLVEQRWWPLREIFDPHWPAPRKPSQRTQPPQTCAEWSLASDWEGALWIIPNVTTCKGEFQLRKFSSLPAGKLRMLTDGKVIGYWIIFFFVSENLRLAPSLFVCCVTQSPADELGWKRKPWANPLSQCLFLLHKM